MVCFDNSEFSSRCKYLKFPATFYNQTSTVHIIIADFKTNKTITTYLDSSQQIPKDLNDLVLTSE